MQRGYEPNLYHYYLGLDLGQSQDPSALAIVEEPIWVDQSWSWEVLTDPVLEKAGWHLPTTLTPQRAEKALYLAYRHGGLPEPPTLQVRHLERFELGTKYPVVVDRVKRLVSSPPLRGLRGVLLCDKTGVGAGVVDTIQQAGLNPTAITITGGSSVGFEEDLGYSLGYRVPKRDLVSAAQVLLQNGLLEIVPSLPLAPILKEELLNFRVKIDPRTAHDSYEHWREGDHDDLVLATAMACWFRQWWNAKLDAANARDVRRKKSKS